MLKRFYILMALVSVAGSIGCHGTEGAEEAVSFQCHVPQAAPYPDGIPYVGVHAGPGNNDFVDCDTAPNFTQAWHALRGAAVVQPNTFSPDGGITYVTSSQPTADACTVWALRTEDGSVAWCRAFDEHTLWSAVEVDADGKLYFTTGTAIVSLNADGTDRWTAATPEGSDPLRKNGAVGLHFTPSGQVVTVTDQGDVLLFDRESGAIVARLNVPQEFGYNLPPMVMGGALTELLPDLIKDDFQSVQMGEPGTLLATFSGAGNFSDNTIAVAPDGTCYVIGGDGSDGALFQVKTVIEDGVVGLEAGWRMHTKQGSASSPAVSPDGRFVKVSDGNGTAGLLNPRGAGALSRIANIGECNANEDSDPDPMVCGESYQVPLLTGPTFGTTPLLNGAVHYQYEIQVADLLNTEDPDVRAFDKDTLLWETHLPDGMQWTSVITVTRNHLIGTGTRFTDSGDSILSIVELPGTAESELVILNRDDGSLAYRAPVSDDSTATVTVGPDGSLYVTMFALMHIFSLDTRPVAGVIRFAPRAL